MKALETYREKLIKNGTVYPYNTYQGFSYDGGKTVTCGQHQCHAQLGHSGDRCTDYFTSLFRNPSLKPEDAKKYWEFLVDPKLSPWRSMLDKVQVIYDDKDYPIGLHMKGDLPAQMVGSLAVATRSATEHHLTVRTWVNLLDHLDPVAALWLTTMFTQEKVGRHFVKKSDTGHYPFHTGNVSLKRLDDANPDVQNGSLKSGARYTPMGSIWRYGGEYTQMYGNNDKNPAVKDLLSKAKYEGSFPVLYKYFVGSLTKSVMVDIDTVVKYIKKNRGSL